MKKANFIFVFILFIMLVLMSCDDSSETNYDTDDHYGKVVIHNDAGSGGTITRIIIDDTFINPTRYYNETVSISQGGKSGEYKLNLNLIYDLLFNGYRITITVGGQEKSATIEAYEDIVNHLYYDGTNLVERK